MRFPKRIAFLLLVVWIQAIGCDAETLRIATYNIRNYLTMNRLVEDRYREDYPKPEKEKAVVRESIHDVNPDLLALQETGSLEMLLELRADLQREGLFYEGFVLMEGSDPTRHVAALWKSGLEVEAVPHKDLDFRIFGERDLMKRGMLELRVSAESDFSFGIFILHLKSKYTNDSRDFQSARRRTLEAEAARNRILEIYGNPSADRFLVLGDLNDGPSSSAVRRFLTRGDLEISQIVECADSHGLIWTHYYRKGAQYSKIDYILASPGMANDVASIKGAIYSHPDYYLGSDHRLVWADIEI